MGANKAFRRGSKAGGQRRQKTNSEPQQLGLATPSQELAAAPETAAAPRALHRTSISPTSIPGRPWPGEEVVGGRVHVDRWWSTNLDDHREEPRQASAWEGSTLGRGRRWLESAAGAGAEGEARAAAPKNRS